MININKFIKTLFVTSICVLLINKIKSLLNVKCNVFLSDKYDIIDNILYYATIISIFSIVFITSYLLYSIIKNRFNRQK
jgi:hypothetical protein